MKKNYIMEDFEFSTLTRMMFGENTHQQAGKIVKEYGFKKVLVHFSGSSAKKSGPLDAVINSFETEEIQYVALGGVQANPTLPKAKEGIELCLKEGADLVLVVGGDSIVDSSRCTVDGVGNLGVDVQTYFRQEVVPARALPVGVILTLSVSGNEMSASCVITNEKNGFKRGFNSVTHRLLLSIYDPELTCMVSRYQTACGIVNIMIHTLERYFSKTRDMELTDRTAEVLLKSTVKTGKIADKDPDSYEARTAFMWGGSLSHNGLTGTGREFFMQVHQLEYEFFGMYPSTAHGVGLATLWSSRARLAHPSDVNRFAYYAIQVWNIDTDFDCPMNTAPTEIWITEDFYKSPGMPPSLKELGVERECLEEMVVKCTDIGKRTLLSIRELGKEGMMEIYRVALGGQRVQENCGSKGIAGMEIPAVGG